MSSDEEEEGGALFTWRNDNTILKASTQKPAGSAGSFSGPVQKSNFTLLSRRPPPTVTSQARSVFMSDEENSEIEYGNENVYTYKVRSCASSGVSSIHPSGAAVHHPYRRRDYDAQSSRSRALSPMSVRSSHSIRSNMYNNLNESINQEIMEVLYKAISRRGGSSLLSQLLEQNRRRFPRKKLPQSHRIRKISAVSRRCRSVRDSGSEENTEDDRYSVQSEFQRSRARQPTTRERDLRNLTCSGITEEVQKEPTRIGLERQVARGDHVFMKPPMNTTQFTHAKTLSMSENQRVSAQQMLLAVEPISPSKMHENRMHKLQSSFESRAQVVKKQAPHTLTSMSASPTKNQTSQTKNPSLHTKMPAIPTKQLASPTKNPALPTKKPASPTKKPASPPKKPVSPTKKPASPPKKPASLTKKKGTPVKKHTSTKRKKMSPIKKQSSPLKLPSSASTMPPPQTQLPVNQSKRLSDVSEVPENQHSSSDMSMRPSFIKRKLFTQTLDIALENEANDNESLSKSPMPNIYSSCPRIRCKQKSLIPRPFVKKSLFDSAAVEPNYINLIQKLVPQEKMNATTGVLTKNITRSSLHVAMSSKNVDYKIFPTCDKTVTAHEQNDNSENDTIFEEQTQKESVIQEHSNDDNCAETSDDDEITFKNVPEMKNDSVFKPSVALRKGTEPKKPNKKDHKISGVTNNKKPSKPNDGGKKHDANSSTATKNTVKVVRSGQPDLKKMDNGLKATMNQERPTECGEDVNKRTINREGNRNKRSATSELTLNKRTKIFKSQHDNGQFTSADSNVNNKKITNKNTPVSRTSAKRQMLLDTPDVWSAEREVRRSARKKVASRKYFDFVTPKAAGCVLNYSVSSIVTRARARLSDPNDKKRERPVSPTFTVSDTERSPHKLKMPQDIPNDNSAGKEDTSNFTLTESALKRLRPRKIVNYSLSPVCRKNGRKSSSRSLNSSLGANPTTSGNAALTPAAPSTNSNVQKPQIKEAVVMIEKTTFLGMHNLRAPSLAVQSAALKSVANTNALWATDSEDDFTEESLRKPRPNGALTARTINQNNSSLQGEELASNIHFGVGAKEHMPVTNKTQRNVSNPASSTRQPINAGKLQNKAAIVKKMTFLDTDSEIDSPRPAQRNSGRAGFTASQFKLPAIALPPPPTAVRSAGLKSAANTNALWPTDSEDDFTEESLRKPRPNGSLTARTINQNNSSRQGKELASNIHFGVGAKEHMPVTNKTQRNASDPASSTRQPINAGKLQNTAAILKNRTFMDTDSEIDSPGPAQRNSGRAGFATSQFKLPAIPPPPPPTVSAPAKLNEPLINSKRGRPRNCISLAGSPPRKKPNIKSRKNESVIGTRVTNSMLKNHLNIKSLMSASDSDVSGDENNAQDPVQMLKRIKQLSGQSMIRSNVPNSPTHSIRSTKSEIPFTSRRLQSAFKHPGSFGVGAETEILANVSNMVPKSRGIWRQSGLGLSNRTFVPRHIPGFSGTINDSRSACSSSMYTRSLSAFRKGNEYDFVHF